MVRLGRGYVTRSSPFLPLLVSVLEQWLTVSLSPSATTAASSSSATASCPAGPRCCTLPTPGRSRRAARAAPWATTTTMCRLTRPLLQRPPPASRGGWRGRCRGIICVRLRGFEHSIGVLYCVNVGVGLGSLRWYWRRLENGMAGVGLYGWMAGLACKGIVGSLA